MKINKSVVLGIVIGAAGLASINYLSQFLSGSGDSMGSGEAEPLYWVAPMDPNFRRDGPGKSPMGMDLVPVYEEGSGGDSPGTIRISSDVVNNLGVVTTIAKMGQLENVVDTFGMVQFDEEKIVHVHPRVEGWVETLYVKTMGERVEKGQALYSLYSPELVNAQEELILALNRNSQALIDAAIGRLKALQIPHDVLNQLKKTRQVQQTITFNAPQTGVINKLNIREGFYVKPGTTMMSIGVLDEVWVQAEVFERQMHQVKVGQPVMLTLDFLPGRTWQGKVDYIYPMLDMMNHTARVRLRFANPDELLQPNMYAKVKIVSQQDQPSLLVPSQAVIRTQDQDRVVLALGGGAFKSVAVKLGAAGHDQVQVLSGLYVGDEIVTSAQFLLDSESYVASDFMRWSHDMDEAAPFARVDGTINSIDLEKWQVNITRGPIKKWNRGPATLDFLVDPSIDLRQLSSSQDVQFRFEIRGDDFIMTDLFSPMLKSSQMTKNMMDKPAMSMDSMGMDSNKMESMQKGEMKEGGMDSSMMKDSMGDSMMKDMKS